MHSRPATVAAILLFAFLASSCGEKGDAAPMTITVTSPAFAANGPIPPRFTCQGEDVSPALRWSGLPAGTRSLALVVEDPDAPDPAHPQTTWVHWIAYDIPPDSAGIPENAGKNGIPGARPGLNDWNSPTWGGPCPPIGRHRYFFKLYALDAPLGELHQPSREKLEKAMQGHILARGELIGTYQKTR